MPNPFFYGNPVPTDQFINRQRELRRITGRIVNQGQSTAIVGEPRSGKTSLLDYLAAPETRTRLYGADGKRLLFAYLNVQTFGGEFSQAQFWEYALEPFYQQVVKPQPDTPLAEAYHTCQMNEFGTFVLERLLAQVGQTGWRLVLLLDEFDALLYHPILNSAEFFGSLRGLAARSRGALALVLSSRQSLTQLNKATQELSRTGSPYFNFLDEITLGPLPKKAITELLNRAKNRFTPGDNRFIGNVAGGHPYLLQAAAYELWEAYAEGQDNPTLQRQQAGHNLYDKAALILSDTWQIWSPTTQRALTAVALAHIPKLLSQRKFHVKRLLRDMRDFGPELRSLEKQGFVSKDTTIPGGWRVRPNAFLWWMADELVRTVRADPSLKEWLQKQGWGLLLTRGEKEQLGKAIRAVAGLLKDGASELIKAAAQGIMQ
jgi:hypothetical protein